MRRSLRSSADRRHRGRADRPLRLLSLVLHAVFARALYRQFDGRLLGDASAVAGMAEDESPEVEFESESLPDFDRGRRPAYFEAWLDDGRVLARSPSLGAGDFARPARPAAPDVHRPRAARRAGGQGGRAPAAAADRRRRRVLTEAPRGSRARFVTVVVARGTEELVETLALVRGWLFGLTLLSLLAASGVALLVVSRGLRSTRALAAKIADLDASRLDSVLPSEGLPDEIAPVVAKINELLARLRESFMREKRFTADVSHELRTPLAGLRTTLEVAASRERAAPEYRAAIEQAGAVVLEMQALCENLLALARLDARLVPVRPQEVPLRALVQACWRPFQLPAQHRNLTFKNEIDAQSVVEIDPDQLRIIVSNLLSNAATYTAPGGTIRVRGGRRTASRSCCWRSSTPGLRSRKTYCRWCSTDSFGATRPARPAFTAGSGWPWFAGSRTRWGWTSWPRTRPTEASASSCIAGRPDTDHRHPSHFEASVQRARTLFS